MQSEKIKKLLINLDSVISIWEEELNIYNEEEFRTITNVSKWSIGQLYQHLIIETRFLNLKNINKSISIEPEHNLSKNIFGKILFIIKTIPPYKFKIRDAKATLIKQPSSIEDVRFNLKLLKAKLREVANNLEKGGARIMHPFLGYLNAYEWFELIEMHFKHHLRQKVKIDNALGKIDMSKYSYCLTIIKTKSRLNRNSKNKCFYSFKCLKTI